MPRLDGEHHIPCSQARRTRGTCPGDGLAQQHHVRLDAAPLVAEQLPSTGNTILNLIADQQNVVLVAQGSGLLQVILVGDNNSSLALNGLHQEGDKAQTAFSKPPARRPYRLVGDRLVHSGNGAAGYRAGKGQYFSRDSGSGNGDSSELNQGTPVMSGSNFNYTGRYSGTCCASVEVVLRTQDHRLVLRNALTL